MFNLGNAVLQSVFDASVLFSAVVHSLPPRFPPPNPAGKGRPGPASPSLPPSTKPPVAKAPVAKPPVAKASTAKPAAAKATQPHSVDTISDDDNDMPSLVTTDESEHDDDRPVMRSAPPAVSSHARESKPSLERSQKGKQAPSAAAAESTSEPSAAAAKGKQVPVTAVAEGKQMPTIASHEPIFKSVSRGYLAQQSNSMAANTNISNDNTVRKEAIPGTGFSFDRASAGGGRAAAKEPQPAAKHQVAASAPPGEVRHCCSKVVHLVAL